MAQQSQSIYVAQSPFGHTRSDRRGSILNWLVADFELKLQMTEQVLARVRGRVS